MCSFGDVWFEKQVLVSQLVVWTEWICGNHGDLVSMICYFSWHHDDVIKWKHFPRYWPFVREINPVAADFPAHKGQWRGALVFSFICAWINGWVNNGEAGDLRRHRANYDVIVISCSYYMNITGNPTNCSATYPCLQQRKFITCSLWMD